MVAQRPIHAPPTNDAPEDRAPDFSRYSRPVDRRAAGFEGAPGSSTPVPLVYHEAFKSRRSLSRADRKEFAIKQAALRVVAGLEALSLRQLARAIGCSHTAIDNAIGRLCERLGMRKFHVSDTTRDRMRAARRRHLAMKASASDH